MAKREAKKSRSKEAKLSRLASFISSAKKKIDKNYKKIKKLKKADIKKWFSSQPREFWLIAGLFIIVLFFIAFLFNFTQVSHIEENTEIEESEQLIDIIHHPLTGEQIDAIPEDFQIYAVIIENSANSWPLSGLDQAFLIIEAPVEGNIPRLLAFFDAENLDLQKIGPVRSARPYYLDWANWFNAIFIHVGGSPEALTRLQNGELRNINEMTNGAYFYRQTTGRFAPHNVFTTSELLRAATLRRDYQPNSSPWNLNFTDSFESSEQVTEIKINIAPNSIYNSSWIFDEEKENYIRTQGRNRFLENGNTIDAENIIVLSTNSAVLDEVGRLRLRTSGEGNMWLFRNGKLAIGKWQADKNGLKLFDNLNNELSLAPGKTWMQIITNDNQLSF